MPFGGGWVTGEHLDCAQSHCSSNRWPQGFPELLVRRNFLTDQRPSRLELASHGMCLSKGAGKPEPKENATTLHNWRFEARCIQNEIVEWGGTMEKHVAKERPRLVLETLISGCGCVCESPFGRLTRVGVVAEHALVHGADTTGERLADLIVEFLEDAQRLSRLAERLLCRESRFDVHAVRYLEKHGI